jgi:uncharacterized protein (DUF1697 family)
MATFVSLFRAINVGGNNRVPMPELKALHEALGLKNLNTYLQTGNVIFESADTDTNQLAAQIANAVTQKFGFHVEVMVRTAAELKALVAKNPYLNQPTKEPQWLVVMFLASRPEEAAKQALRSAYSGPEEFSIGEQELFIYYPEGIGRSKFTNAFIEKKLKVLGTGRNWNTVAKLLELTQQT